MANAVSHDQNFKNLILDYPRDALGFFAPSEAPAAGDDVSVTPVRQEQLQQRLGGNWRELDVPLLVKWRDVRRDAVLFALEEETDRRAFSPHRLAHYCLDLAEMHGTDRVVPVAIFLRKGPALAPLTLGTEQNAYLRFKHIQISLGEMRAEDWQDSGNVVARVNLLGGCAVENDACAGVENLPREKPPALREAPPPKSEALFDSPARGE